MKMYVRGEAILVAISFLPQRLPFSAYPVEALHLGGHRFHLRIMEFVTACSRTLRPDHAVVQEFHLAVAERLAARKHGGGNREDPYQLMLHPIRHYAAGEVN